MYANVQLFCGLQNLKRSQVWKLFSEKFVGNVFLLLCKCNWLKFICQKVFTFQWRTFISFIFGQHKPAIDPQLLPLLLRVIEGLP